MADSYLDIDYGGDEVIFPFEIDWASKPRATLHIARYLFENPGGASDIAVQSPHVPFQFQAQVSFYSKQEEYQFLEFVHDRRGKAKRFWFKYPRAFFKLDSNVGSSDSVIKVENNSFNLQCQGYERIFIELANGDMITRKVLSAVYNDVNDNIELTLNSAIGVDILLTESIKIGRFLLCRFDDERFKIKCVTDYVSSCHQRYIELVREYDEIAED